MFTAAEIESCVVPIMALLSAYRNRVTGTGTGSIGSGRGGSGGGGGLTVADIIKRAERLYECFCFIAAIYDTHSSRNRSAESVQRKKLRGEWTSAHVLMSHMYTAAGRTSDAARVLALMKDRNLKKRPAISWMQVRTANGAYQYINVLVHDRP